jgi:tripartite-type tricarboxylate transporter receptor subunit TctC
VVRHWCSEEHPAELIERLNKQVNISIADPKFKARLANLGGTALAGSPADFGKLIADDTEKVGQGGAGRATDAAVLDPIFDKAR